MAGASLRPSEVCPAHRCAFRRCGRIAALNVGVLLDNVGVVASNVATGANGSSALSAPRSWQCRLGNDVVYPTLERSNLALCQAAVVAANHMTLGSFSNRGDACLQLSPVLPPSDCSVPCPVCWALSSLRVRESSLCSWRCWAVFRCTSSRKGRIRRLHRPSLSFGRLSGSHDLKGLERHGRVRCAVYGSQGFRTTRGLSGKVRVLGG